MPFDKDKAIIAQNSATAAAAIVAAEVKAGVVPDALDRFREVRQAIFEGSLDLAGVEAVVTRLESGVTAPDTVGPHTPIGGVPNADFELRNGKHAGKTLAAIDLEDRSYLEWAAGNLNNDFAKRKIAEYVRATAA